MQRKATTDSAGSRATSRSDRFPPPYANDTMNRPKTQRRIGSAAGAPLSPPDTPNDSSAMPGPHHPTTVTTWETSLSSSSSRPPASLPSRNPTRHDSTRAVRNFSTRSLPILSRPVVPGGCASHHATSSARNNSNSNSNIPPGPVVVPSFSSTTISGLSYHGPASSLSSSSSSSSSSIPAGPASRPPRPPVGHRSSSAPWGPHLTGLNGPPLQLGRVTYVPPTAPPPAPRRPSVYACHITTTAWAVIHVQGRRRRPPSHSHGGSDTDDEREATATATTYLIKRLRFDASEGTAAGDYAFVQAPTAPEMQAWYALGNRDGEDAGTAFRLPDGGRALHVPCEALVQCPRGYVRCVGRGGALADGAEVYDDRLARWRLRTGRWAVEGCLKAAARHNAAYGCGCDLPRLAARARESVKVWAFERGEEVEVRAIEKPWEGARGWGRTRREVRGGIEQGSRGVKAAACRAFGKLCREKGDNAKTPEPLAADASVVLDAYSWHEMVVIDPAKPLGRSTSQMGLLAEARLKAGQDSTAAPASSRNRVDSLEPAPVVKPEQMVKLCTKGCIRAKLYAKIHSRVCGCNGLGEGIAKQAPRIRNRTKRGMLGDACAVLMVKLGEAWVG